MGCNICNCGDIGVKWTKELRMGSKSLRAAGIEFTMTPDEVFDHVKNHVLPENDSTSLVSLLDDPNFFYNELLTLFRNLKDWLTFTMETERWDKSNMDMGIKLIREIRETLKFIAELQGKLNKGDTYHQQFLQIQGDLNLLMGTVLNKMCPTCQQEVLNDPNITKLLELKDGNTK